MKNEEHWDRVLWLCDSHDAKAHDSFGHIRAEVLELQAKVKELEKELASPHYCAKCLTLDNTEAALRGEEKQ